MAIPVMKKTMKNLETRTRQLEASETANRKLTAEVDRLKEQLHCVVQAGCETQAELMVVKKTQPRRE